MNVQNDQDLHCSQRLTCTFSQLRAFNYIRFQLKTFWEGGISRFERLFPFGKRMFKGRIQRPLSQYNDLRGKDIIVVDGNTIEYSVN